MEYKIDSPLFVILKRVRKPNRKCYLNLNNYPNWHYHTYNEIKKTYNEVIFTVLNGLKFKTPIILYFKLFKEDKRKTDRANTLAVIEKFFCDSMVNHGCIPEDDDSIIESTHYSTGGIDRKNPRCEIIIKEV
jgi:hypothetical protein